MEELRTPQRPKYRVAKSQQRGTRIQPWTASRCQRLLRPLLSRIGILRRSATLPNQVSADKPLVPEDTSTKRAAEDCSWLAPRKKLRHTYSQRCSSGPLLDTPKPGKAKFKAAKDLKRDSCTGETVAFTPLLRRARGYTVSSPIQEPVVNRNDGQRQRQCTSWARENVSERLASLKKQISQARFADYEAIFRNTEVLLSTVDHSAMNKGASSLIDMCLRKVPQYVAGIEAWEIHEAEINGTKSNTTGADVAPKVYTELESLGASDTGWMHLRTVVQADAFTALAAAMAEGLFPDELSMLLIELCSEQGAFQLNHLLEVFLGRHYPEPLSSESTFSEDARLRPLSFLRDISRRSDRPPLMLQQLSSLLVQGLLPSSWLATREFEDVWALAYRMIPRSRTAFDAVDFLATSTVLLCRRRQLGTKQKHLELSDGLSLSRQLTLVQALSILSAMRRLGEDAVSNGSGSNSERVMRIGRSLGFILHASIAEVESWKGRQGKSRELLCLATFLSSLEPQGERTDAHVTKVIETMHDNQRCKIANAAHTMISLIAAIAKICGRGTSQASRHYLIDFCQQLGRLEIESQVLEDIKKAGAFFLAQQSNDLRDLLYAEKLVTNSDDLRAGQVSVPGRHSIFEGYRWDESISEWITASPVMQQKLPKGRSLRSSIHDSADLPATNVDTMPVSPIRPVDLEFLVADSSREQGPSTCARLETSDRSMETTAGKILGTLHQPYRVAIPVADNQSRATGHSRRHSCAPRAKVIAVYDELSDDKENCNQVMSRKRHSDVSRLPLVTKRRVRLSWGDHHSDDELGL